MKINWHAIITPSLRKPGSQDAGRDSSFRWYDVIQIFNGNNQYQKYLQHFTKQHPSQTALTKQQFFAQKEQEKWSKINRCC